MLASIRTILFRYIYDRNLSSSPSCLGLGVTNWLTVTKYTLHKRQWIFSVLRRFSRSSITQRLLSNWQWLCLSSICVLSQILSVSLCCPFQIFASVFSNIFPFQAVLDVFARYFKPDVLHSQYAYMYMMF